MAWVIGIAVFLLLLFLFPRAMGGLILVCGIAIGGWLLSDKLEHDKRARERAAVSLTVTHDIERCGPEYPLLISIKNGSDRTLEWVSFHIVGHRTGYSEPLYYNPYDNYSSDRIIASSEIWSSCWTLPSPSSRASKQTIAVNPPDTLVWSAPGLNPRFRDR